jgi:hypothetical protein
VFADYDIELKKKFKRVGLDVFDLDKDLREHFFIKEIYCFNFHFLRGLNKILCKKVVGLKDIVFIHKGFKVILIFW